MVFFSSFNVRVRILLSPAWQNRSMLVLHIQRRRMCVGWNIDLGRQEVVFVLDLDMNLDFSEQSSGSSGTRGIIFLFSSRR